MKRLRVLGIAVLFLMGLVGTPPAFADSVAPATFSATLAVGGSTSVDKVVTIDEAVSAPVDVFFLVDTTGSMGGVIEGVKTGFADVVASLGAVATNVAFGVGEYKDFGDPFAYRENQDITTNTADVQTGINLLSASGGGDLPEANLFGLESAAEGTSWRDGSARFIVWVGDAPGHDPSGGSTEASVIAALNAENIDVFAASATSGPGLNQTLQATAITAAVGGAFLGTFIPADVVDEITDALVTGLTTYTSVGLQITGLPAGVSVSLPAPIVGSFDRSIARMFNFDDVTFTGLAPGTYNFTIDVVLNGTRVVASETDTIVVGGPTGVPEPTTLTLFGLGIIGGGIARRRLRRQTA
jgi:hypothetical protein